MNGHQAVWNAWFRKECRNKKISERMSRIKISVKVTPQKNKIEEKFFFNAPF